MINILVYFTKCTLPDEIIKACGQVLFLCRRIFETLLEMGLQCIDYNLWMSQKLNMTTIIGIHQKASCSYKINFII